MKFNEISKITEITESEEVKTVSNKVKELVKKTESILTVQSSKDEQIVLNLTKEIKVLHNEIKNKENFFLNPVRQYMKSVQAIFRNVLKALETAEQTLKAKLQIYREKLEEQAKKLQEKAEKKVEKQIQQGKIPSVIPNFMPEKSVYSEKSVGTYKKRWVGEIIDEKKVPREYCRPDMVLINQAIKQGIRNIPGVKIYEKTEVSIR